MSNSKVLISLVLVFTTYAANYYSLDTFKVPFVSGNYAVKTEILMPNLAENLRYATTQTQQCLTRQDAFSIFPILKEKSFMGCGFVKNKNSSTELVFDLICANRTAATGSANIVISEKNFRATLAVKMGGKNMKFTQLVSGHRIGSCS